MVCVEKSTLRWQANSLLATRLDKRAELIRERRYNALPGANDPKVVYPSDGVGSMASSGQGEMKDGRSLASNNADDLPMYEGMKLVLLR